MGKVIVIGATIVLVVIGVILLIMFLRKQESKDEAHARGWALHGDLTHDEEELLKDYLRKARSIMQSVLKPPADLNIDSTLLSPQHRLMLENWLGAYERQLSTKKGWDL